MNTLTKTLLIISISFFTITALSYAGQINNVVINAKGNSKVVIKSSKTSKINNIKVTKDPKAKVIINDKEINCENENKDSKICKPQ
jgi:flagellar basal body P-ring protein FlgI